MKYNINETVKVVLTKKGAEILNDFYEHMPLFAIPKEKYKEDDEYSTEMWHLFNIFGKHIFLGCDIPFKDNVVEIVGK